MPPASGACAWLLLLLCHAAAPLPAGATPRGGPEVPEVCEHGQCAAPADGKDTASLLQLSREGATKGALEAGELPEHLRKHLYEPNYRGKDAMWCVGLNAVGFDLGASGGRDGSYHVPSREAIQYFHNQGANCFRLPITWERLQSSLGSEDVDPVGGVRETVEFITETLGDHVIIDPHNNEQGLRYNNKNVNQWQFVNLWKAITREWGQNTKCIFGLYNEPRYGYANDRDDYFNPDDVDRDGSISEAWRQWMQGAIDAIRQRNSSNMILVPGLHWTSTGSWDGGGWWGETVDGQPNAGNSRLAALVDPKNRIAYDVHTYMDLKFTGELTGCGGHDTSFWCQGSPGCSGNDQGLTQAVAWAKRYNKKFMVTEIGSWPEGGTEGMCKAKMEDHLRRMKESGVFLGYQVWQFGCPQCLADQWTRRPYNLDWYRFDLYGGHCTDPPCLGDDSRAVRWKEHPEMCLDVAGGAQQDGSNLQIWPCTPGSLNQQLILPAPGRAAPIQWATHPEYCVDVSGGDSTNGNNVQLWACGDGKNPNMQFLVASGQGTIRWAAHPDKCLDVAGGGVGAGTNVQLWSCGSSEGGPNSRFIFPANRSGGESAEVPGMVQPVSSNGHLAKGVGQIQW